VLRFLSDLDQRLTRGFWDTWIGYVAFIIRLGDGDIGIDTSRKTVDK
jgi:hypothetical protein